LDELAGVTDIIERGAAGGQMRGEAWVHVREKAGCGPVRSSWASRSSLMLSGCHEEPLAAGFCPRRVMQTGFFSVRQVLLLYLITKHSFCAYGE